MRGRVAPGAFITCFNITFSCCLRTCEKCNAARTVASTKFLDAIYRSCSKFKSSHAAQILQFLTDNIVYIGFTMQNGKGREWEQCRFALHDQGPPFVRRDGRKIKGPKELGQLGFCSLTLHESSFANNIIKLETQLQTLLWNQKNRLWRQCSGSCMLGLDSSTRLHFYYLVFTEISVTRESLVSSHQWSPQRPR